MSRLDGGPCTVSSSSRSCLRARSSPGAWRELPAPAGVPVERRVRIGLVRPFTVRPVLGVWARVSSRPLPPALRRLAAFAGLRAVFRAAGRDVLREADVFRAFAAFRRAEGLAPSEPVFRRAEGRLPGRGGLVAFLRFAFPFGVLAPAVLRLPAADRPPVRAFARAPAPAFRLDGVRRWRRFLLVFALFFVLAIPASERAGPRARATVSAFDR